MKRKDYREAIRLGTLAADKNNKDIFFMPGGAYAACGEHAQGRHWLEKARAAGHPRAEKMLVEVIADENFIRGAHALNADDAKTALIHFKMAANQGHKDAMSALAMLLMAYGELDKAEPWVRKAKENGGQGADAALEMFEQERKKRGM